MHLYSIKLLPIFIFSIHLLQAQSSSDSLYIIDRIEVSGNEKTKNSVILTEIRIQKGQSILCVELDQQLDRIKSNLLRTNLFSKVDIRYIIDHREGVNYCNISIDVVENWLLFPAPIFDLADRNFNVWWVEQDRSWKRVNYGLKLFHYNLSGYRDVLRFVYHTGFTNKFELNYDFPYLLRKKFVGFRFGGTFTTNKEIDYITTDNKNLSIRDENQILLRRREAYVDFYYRPSATHSLLVGSDIFYNTINDTVATLNSNYYLEGSRTLRLFAFNVGYQINHLDIQVRPTKGYRLELGMLYQNGNHHSIQSLLLEQSFAWIKKLNYRTSYFVDAKAREQVLRKPKPFALYKALGYADDFVAGYEYYVINGEDYILWRHGFRIYLFNINRSFFKLLRSEPRIRIKTEFDLVFSNDLSYVNDPHYAVLNPLSNRLLTGLTLGGECTINNNIRAQLQLSINHKRELGVFIHSRSAF